jgi:hypothetical protein
VVTGTHSGPLAIGPGVTILSGATITGPVTIALGAIVSIAGSAITGPLTAKGPGSLALCGSSVFSSHTCSTRFSTALWTVAGTVSRGSAW